MTPDATFAVLMAMLAIVAIGTDLFRVMYIRRSPPWWLLSLIHWVSFVSLILLLYYGTRS